MTVFRRAITKLSYLLFLTAFASSSFAQVRNLNDSARKAVPVENYTSESWLGQYVADNAPDAIYELFMENPKYALYAKTHGFGEDSKFCAASIGLTESTNDSNRSPRLPTSFYHGAFTKTKSFEGEDGCYSKALKQAISKLFKDDIRTLRSDLAFTKDDQSSPPKSKKNTDALSSTSSGLSTVGKDSLRNLHPDWFTSVIDYRYYSVVYEYSTIDAENGDTVCLAVYGLTARPSTTRIARHPIARNTRGKIIKTSEAESGDMDALCFWPMWKAIISENTIDSEIFKVFTKNWDSVAEFGSPAPTMKNILAAHNTWTKEQERKTRQAEQRQQKSAIQSKSNLSCSNECFNGSCTRTFSNGRKERWQAPRVYNPLTSNWEWDISTNACGS